jgi:CRP-like cAMP-binding protein
MHALALDWSQIFTQYRVERRRYRYFCYSHILGTRVLSTIDRLIILKSISIFSETPDDILIEVTSQLKDHKVKAGEVIFEKGEFGDCLYIIVEGEVRVYDGERTLNHLGERAVFGEMAVLDPAPRSTSVMATTATTLFRLDRDSFYRSIGGRVEVLHRIIHILCQHLRLRIDDSAEDYKYMAQFARVTAAAAAVEAGAYDPSSLDEVASRTDALGQLARVFQHMAAEVYAREQQLQQRVQALQIELSEAKQQRQVAEITETTHFQGLLAKASSLRAIMDGTKE